MPLRRPPVNKQTVNPVELLNQISLEIEKHLVAPDIQGYVPHEKQNLFHQAPQKGRLFLGGNRAGKTTAGVAEDIFWLKQDHPYRDLSEVLVRGIPTRGRAIVVDFNILHQVLIPEYKRWMPPSLLKDGSWDKSFDKSRNILTLVNGATLDFKTYEQDMDKHSGTSRHYVHFDEEAPEHIFNENMLRLLDTDGHWWMTMTPLLGVTWLYDKFKMDEHPDEESYVEGNVYISRINTLENPNLSKAAIASTFEGMSEDEIKSRQEGRFVEVGGLVFKNFDKNLHVIEPTIPPKTWEWYMSLDSGWNNPTAILWHAVSPEGMVITFDEIYQKETTVSEFARMIKEREKRWGKQPFLRTGDPAIRQTREVTGTSVQQEYASHDIYLSLDGVPTGAGSVDIGIQKMQTYMGNKKMADGTVTPAKWFITENCVHTIKELRKLRWATFNSKNLQNTMNPQEKIHKKDDHTFDSARYFFTLLPDPRPDAPGSLNPATKQVRSWQEELLWREQQEAAGNLLDLSGSSRNNIESMPHTTWDVVESYRELV